MAILTAVLLVIIVGGAAVAAIAAHQRSKGQPEIDHGRGDARPQPWEERAAGLSSEQPSMHPQGRGPESQAPDTADR